MSEYEVEDSFFMNHSRRKFTKEEQMLSIWADSNNDDDEQSARHSARGFSKRPKNYTAPVNFVSGGIQQLGEPKEDDDDDDDMMNVPNSSSESNDDDVKNDKSRQSFSTYVESGIAGSREKRAPINPALMNTGVGGWEVHTKGIGAKLLLKMGFEPGKGLGKKMQGISTPVEFHLRRGRGAIGAYESEKFVKLNDECVKKQKVFKKKLSHWRKSKISKNKKQIKYQYRSVDKVLKVTNSLANIKSLFRNNSLSNSELQHNINLLVDICQQNIIQNYRRIRHLSDRVVTLETEKKNMSKIVSHQQKLIDTFENVLTIGDTLMMKNDEMTLEEASAEFQKLHDEYYEEYKMYELGELANNFVVPEAEDYLATWSPLIDPKQPINIIKNWKDILEAGLSRLQTRNMLPNDQLIWDTWMPSMCAAVQEWNCRHPEPLIELIEDCMPRLPAWILDNVLDLHILPKLTLEVGEWNPLADTVPIHTWIHPWMPLMGSRMDTLIYPIIRCKLGSALNGWHPSDRSARLMIEPWLQVFSESDMEAFLVENIIPKLKIALLEFVINPYQQHLDNWNWVFDWVTLLPIHTMVGLLDKFFFPKWLRVLAFWLNHSSDYDQITHWCMGWEEMLNDRLLAQPVIKDHFKKALDMINQAISTSQIHQPGAMEQVSYLTTLERGQLLSQEILAASQPHIEGLAEAIRTASQIAQGFKNHVQENCEERGISFMPIPNRYEEAEQVYEVDNVQACIDDNVLFIRHNGEN